MIKSSRVTITFIAAVIVVNASGGTIPGSEAIIPELPVSPQVDWIEGMADKTEFVFTSQGESYENRRCTVEVKLAASGEPAVLSWPLKNGGMISELRIWGDTDDAGLVHLELATPAQENEVPVAPEQEDFRLWPAVDSWSRNEDERLAYTESFKSLPSWDQRWFRAAVDFTASETRVWIEGRMIWTQATDQYRANQMKIALPKGAERRRCLSFPLPEARFLSLDLSSYYNNDALQGGDLGDGFAFDDESLYGCGMVGIAGIPFYVEWLRGQDNNCDLGETDCRDYLPYINCDALSSDPKRMLLRVPKRYYDRAHLICVADKEDGEIPSAAIRMIKTWRGHEATATYAVPYWDDVIAKALPLACGPRGKMWLVNVPLNPADFQDFLASEDESFLELDLTKLVGLDSEKYLRPMGPASSVHVFALTLEEAPAKMVVTSEAIGHIFEEPNHPVMQVQLHSQRSEKREYELAVTTVDPSYRQEQQKHQVTLGPYEERTENITLPDPLKGKYDVTFRLTDRDEGRSIARSTTYAVLPSYQRQARDDSPFGVWCFFEQHHGAGPEIAGPLFKMLGARWTLPNFLCNRSPEENAKRVEILNRYGVTPSFGYLCGIHNTGWKGPGDVEAKIEELRTTPWVKNFNVFWESSVSSGTRDIIPPEIMGKAPLELSDEGVRNVENCRKTGVAYSSRVREEFSEAKLIFGNGFPYFISCMLRYGYPKEYIDGCGLDFDLYTSMPERQPSIPYAPFNGLYFLKKVQEYYGYEEFPRYLTEAIYAPVAPGWLTEREQADHYVRTYLLAMAAGVKYFGMCTEIWDPGGWYGYGHYGPVGFCHRPPELNPRESFCAYATMTAVLDQCRYERLLPTGSPSVFGVEFRNIENKPVYALWTIRGKRPLTLHTATNASATITDCFGNQESKEITNDSLDVILTSSPLYIEGIGAIENIVLGDAEYDQLLDNGKLLVALNSLEHWEQEQGRYEVLEKIDPDVPFVKSPLSFSIQKNDRPGRSSLSVALPEVANWHPIETPYSVLKRTGPEIQIPVSASSIGAWVCGNSSWGRILFELKDAAGQRWLSARSESTFIDFDGYRYIGVDLPHMPKGKRVEPVGFRPWVCNVNKDVRKAVPAYPMTLTRLIFETRSHTIRGGEIESVPVTHYEVDRIVCKTLQE